MGIYKILKIFKISPHVAINMPDATNLCRHTTYLCKHATHVCQHATHQTY
jgi:hypothetical protein